MAMFRNLIIVLGLLLMCFGCETETKGDVKSKTRKTYTLNFQLVCQEGQTVQRAVRSNAKEFYCVDELSDEKNGMAMVQTNGALLIIRHYKNNRMDGQEFSIDVNTGNLQGLTYIKDGVGVKQEVFLADVPMPDPSTPTTEELIKQLRDARERLEKMRNVHTDIPAMTEIESNQFIK